MTDPSGRRDAAAPTFLRPTSSGGDAARRGRAEGRVDAIAAAVRRAVVEHRLPPGTKLPETELGTLFGASRTLVRAALQGLARDGLVTLARNRGAAVASPTVEDARDLFEARRVIEAALARRAAALARPADGAALDRLIARGRAAALAGNRGAAIRLAGEFHLTVAAIARRPVLRGFLADLTSRTSLVIALYGRSGASDCGADEHTALCRALLANDPDAAEALMARHLAHIEADLDLAGAGRTPVTLAAALGRGGASS